MRNRIRVLSCLLLLMLSYSGLYAQTHGSINLKIQIIDNDQNGVPFIKVFFPELQKGALTDSLGLAEFTLPNAKHYHLLISGTGYKSVDTTLISIPHQATLKINLHPSQAQLKTIQIKGETHGEILKQEPIKAQVINTLAVKEQPTSLIDLINRSSGIRVRQSGSLGSNSEINLNGFQGRSIRYFKDGLPLDFLGSGFTLSLVPVNILDHIEVYRGVLPVYLGADALGGAVNLVTRNTQQNFADFSYEFGSFNTHRVSVNAAWHSKNEKISLGINGFYNYSKGDYKVDVQTPDPQTGVLENVNTRLFNNKFSNYYVETFLGVKDILGNDELKLLLSGFGLKKQFPFGATMFKPFGQTHGNQYSFIPGINYKKGFLDDKLQLSVFAEINTLHTKIVDTAHGHYDWLGNFTPNPQEKGEISNEGTYSHINYRYLTSRINLSYQLAKHHRLDYNLVIGNFHRKGDDPFGKKFPEGVDFLSVPATYNKMVMALGLKSDFLDKKIENNLIVKFYNYRTKASDLTIIGDSQAVRNVNHQWGIADGIKFKVSPRSTLQFSVESALRLPEQDEIFGDGGFKLANFDLKPERSLNFNLSFQNREAGKYYVELNTFFRRTKNMILLVPVYFLNSQNQNVEDVRGIGMDADLGYHLWPWLELTGNFTYQDLRLIHSPNPNRELSRLRNTPYFFSNLGLNIHLKRLIGKNDPIEFYWYYSFVRQFYLDYIPKSVEPSGFLGLWGNAKIDARNIIPNQNIQTAGFTYHPFKKPFTFGFQVRNLLNAKIYDNFRVQNPGRSYSIKLSYSIL